MHVIRDDIDVIWPEIVKAFAFYGKKIRPNPSNTRRNLLQKLLNDGFEPHEMAMAVHGYVHAHEGLDRVFGNGLTSGHYLRPETVFKADGFEDRVERGECPWVYIDPKARHEQQVKARQAAARERFEQARLRSVGVSRIQTP